MCVQIDLWEFLSAQSDPDGGTVEEKKEKEDDSTEDPGIEADFFDEELDLLTNMIHAPAPQYHHSRPFQVGCLPLYFLRLRCTVFRIVCR